MVAETERVARELSASQLRSRLAEQFLQQYQLSPEEIAALQVLFTTSSLSFSERGL